MSIRNPIEEIRKALPELENTNGNIKTISIDNWDSRIKRIQTQIRKKYKRYSGLPTYQAYLNPCVVEYENTFTGCGIVKIDEAKYKLIRKYLLSDEFNLKEGTING